MNSLHMDHARAYADYRVERLRKDRTPPAPGRPPLFEGLLLKLRLRFRRRVAEVAALTEAAVAEVAVLAEPADDAAAA